MKSPVDNLIDYLGYRMELGERTVDLEPETVAALRSMSAAPAQSAVQAPGPSRAILAAPAFAAPRPGAGTVSAPSGNASAPRPDFIFVGEREGTQANQRKYSEMFFKMISSMGYRRDEIALTNICIGRKADTPPSEAEIAAYLPAFREKLAQSNPKAMVVFGAVAAKALLGIADISSIHGRRLSFDGVPAIPTYHPATMVDFPELKRRAFGDLCKAMKTVGHPIPQIFARFQ